MVINMKYENFTLQSSLEANYLNIQLQESMELDEIAINVIREDCPDFLIPFRMVDINGSVSLKYKLINTIALEYADMTLHKSEFISFYMSLLNPFINGNDWFLDYHNFCIDARYIYLDKVANKTAFIYIPEQSYRSTDEEILEFFKNTFIRITIVDDANFQVRLYQYFAQNDVTLAGLYRLLQEENKKVNSNVAPVASVPKVPQASQPQMYSAMREQPNPVKPESVKPESVQVPVKEPAKMPVPDSNKGIQDEVASDSDEVMQALFGDGKKKSKEKPVKEKSVKEKPVKEKNVPEKKAGGFSLFGKKKEPAAVPEVVPAGNPQQNNPQEVIYAQSFSMMNSDDKTEIFTEDVVAGAAYLELIESPIQGAIPRIDLGFDKPYITIGRSSSDEIQPDVAFSREFSRIGRKHARIEKKNGLYYVIDLGSVNHTLLNGVVLMPNEPCQLLDGGELTFTDSKPVRYRIHL